MACLPGEGGAVVCCYRCCRGAGPSSESRVEALCLKVLERPVGEPWLLQSAPPSGQPGHAGGRRGDLGMQLASAILRLTLGLTATE